MDTRKDAKAAGTIPVIEVPASAIGPLGITLGPSPDAGGGRETAGTVVIPLLKVNWLDERQTCIRVLAFVHDGQTPDLAGCPQYRGGSCTRGGSGTPCAFLEDPNAAIWRKAAGWKYDPVSGCAVPKSLWADFGLEVGP
jgi:hypothetical protein